MTLLNHIKHFLLLNKHWKSKNLFKVTVIERYGEYEATDHIIVAIPHGTDEQTYLKQLCIEWRGMDEEDFDDDMDGCWFDCNLVCMPRIDKKLNKFQAYIACLWFHQIKLDCEYA